MQPQYLLRRDTSAWVGQVWASFAAAVLMCGVGVANLDGESIDRAFLSIAFFFCLSASFTLAKTIRDNRDEQVDTRQWMMQVWAAFVIAVVMTAWGLFRLDLGAWQKGYMLCSGLFLISSTFTLAKTVRDNHEAQLLDRGTQPVLEQLISTKS